MLKKKENRDRKMLSRAFNFLANAWLHNTNTVGSSGSHEHLLSALPGLMKLCNFDSLFMCSVFQGDKAETTTTVVENVKKILIFPA